MTKIKLSARRAVLGLLLVWGAGVATAQEGQPRLPTVQLTAGINLIKAEVASTPEQRATGLMFRRTMGNNEGMLFVFEQPSQQCFWMQNTLLPLSVAFVDDEGRIVNLDDMKPLTQNSHCSTGPVRYVLEMNVGWFAKRGIGAGFKLQGEPFRH